MTVSLENRRWMQKKNIEDYIGIKLFDYKFKYIFEWRTTFIE